MIPRHAYEPRDGTDEHMCVCGSHFFDSIHFTSSGFATDAWKSYKGTRQSIDALRFPHPYRPDESGWSGCPEGGYPCVCGLAPVHERHHFPWMVTQSWQRRATGTTGTPPAEPDILRRPPKFKTLEEADAWMTRMAAEAR